MKAIRLRFSATRLTSRLERTYRSANAEGLGLGAWGLGLGAWGLGLGACTALAAVVKRTCLGITSEVGGSACSGGIFTPGNAAATGEGARIAGDFVMLTGSAAAVTHEYGVLTGAFAAITGSGSTSMRDFREITGSGSISMCDFASITGSVGGGTGSGAGREVPALAGKFRRLNAHHLPAERMANCQLRLATVTLEF